MNIKEIIIDTNTEGSELIADAFFSIGCSGVKILDKNDILDIINNNKLWDYVDENLLKKDDTVKVSGFVAEEDWQAKLKELHSIIDKYPFVNKVTINDSNTDWYNNWKKFYKPIEEGSYVVVPEWMKYQNKDNKIEVLIDPGMAFGTGEHQSTRLCLRLMSEIDFKGKKVIDVGTGSGILGIAAKKSGAENCYMCDIDSIAVKAAKQNSDINGIKDNVTIEQADLLEKEPQKADIITANLTADILLRLLNGITKHFSKGGFLICSGIINSRYNEVANTYKNQGFEIIKTINMDDWSAILFRG